MLTKNNLIHKNIKVKGFFVKEYKKSHDISGSDNKITKSVPKKPKNIKIIRKCSSKLEETWMQ